MLQLWQQLETMMPFSVHQPVYTTLASLVEFDHCNDFLEPTDQHVAVCDSDSLQGLKVLYYKPHILVTRNCKILTVYCYLMSISC